MEPLAADELEEAKLEADSLLDEHASGYAAHIFQDEERVATLRRRRGNADQVPAHLE